MDRNLCLLAVDVVFLPTLIYFLEAEVVCVVRPKAIETLRGE